MKRNTIIGIVVAIILVIGGILIIKKAKKKDAAAPVAKSYSLVVSTIKPVLNEVHLTLPYLAIVQNDADVVIASRIASRIEYLKPSGSFVKAGEVIARLDNTTFESNIESIKAQMYAVSTALKNMNSTHKRTLELLAVKGASIEQSEMEMSKISEAEAKLEALKQNMSNVKNSESYAIITAPASGKISKTMQNTGDMAMPGHPIANIRANNGFYLLIRVPTDLNISGVTMNGKRYDAIKLNSTFNGLAEYKAFVDAANLISGDRVEINVEVFNGTAIELPFDAILNRNGKSFVLLKEGDRATAQEVNIIQSGEKGIAVSNEELQGKELIVAKQDILLKLLSGISLKVKED